MQCCAQPLFCHPPIPLCAGNYSMHQACVGDTAAAASPHLSAPTRFSVHHMVPTSTSMSVVLPRTNSSPRLAPLALLFPLVSAMAGCARGKTFSGGTERGSRGEGRGGARTKTTKSSRDGAVEAPRRPPVRSPKQRLPQTGSSLCLLRRARHPLRCPPQRRTSSKLSPQHLRSGDVGGRGTRQRLAVQLPRACVVRTWHSSLVCSSLRSAKQIKKKLRLGSGGSERPLQQQCSCPRQSQSARRRV